VSFSSDGKTLASACSDCSIKLWDVASCRNTATLKEEHPGAKELPYLWATAAFSPDGKTLATGGWFNRVKMWDVATLKGQLLAGMPRKAGQQLKRVGPVGDVLAGTQGMGDRITGGEDTEQRPRRVQGMIDAMTKEERDSPDILDDPRRRRVAAGAGVQPQDVEQFLGQFQRVRVLMRQMAQMSIWREGGP
jgi:hypothetical protein